MHRLNRPRKEQVDEAMRHRWAGVAADEAVPVLQAEVRALREELAAAESVIREQTESLVKFAYDIARVEALPAKWRHRAWSCGDYGAGREYQDSENADELDAALRPCASSEPDTAPISAPDGQAAEPVVLENPAKQRGKLL